MKIPLGILALAALPLGGCTIHHAVAADYPQYLANNAGESHLPRTDRATRYILTPSTQAYTYEFTSRLTGRGNLWMVDVGEVLDDTLRSADVQAAFGRLEKASPVAGTESANGTGNSGTLVFSLLKYSFEDAGAHVGLQVALFRNGRMVFQSVYLANGETQLGKMALAGVFGQKNAVQQSTKLALDEILERLITDLNALPAGAPVV